jgi:UDP-glucose 4-epimerase
MTSAIPTFASRDIASRVSPQRFLITGASGFIGAHLCRRLCESGCEVHATSRSPHDNNSDGVIWWQMDMAHEAAVREVITIVKPKIIFHLSACVSGQQDLSVVLPTLRDNLISTVNLLTAAATVGCERLILAGSLEEPDMVDQDQPVPCSPYAASKWSASAYARMFYQLYKMPVAIARLFMTYGPAQRDHQKLIPYVTRSLLRGTPPKVTDGSRPVDWIYVDDAVNGLVAVSQATGVEGRTIDIGSGTLVPVRVVVQNLAELIGTQVQPLFGALPARAFERIRVADAVASRALLGWETTTSLEDGLARTVDWYREQTD